MKAESQEINSDIINLKAKCLASLLHFIKIYFKVMTGREFAISHPTCRESHFITICRKLVDVFEGRTKRLIINVPPRYGKTTLLIHFVAWALARYQDCNFLYVSYSKDLATKQTQNVRDILNLPAYRNLFGVQLNQDSLAKDDFKTSKGGNIVACGAGGTITGYGAGIKGVNRFGGSVIIDDIHKPDEALSDTIRGGVIEWYHNTMKTRLNDGENTPIIFIGQRVHEDDLAARLIDTKQWETVVLPALDMHENALYPEMHTREQLLQMKADNPYVFAAQMQQNPQPAGGGVFKKDWFFMTEEEPKILATFITIDSAETASTLNDATAMSFWGLYKVVQNYIETDVYALHWIDAMQVWIEAKDLETEVLAFYSQCMRHQVKPSIVAIEKKSTGVTLIGVLKKIQGLNVHEIERPGMINGRANSKAIRFLQSQPYVAKNLISFPRYGKHVPMCVEHCSKITLNDTHRFDDLADNLNDAIQIGLIDKIVIGMFANRGKTEETNTIVAKILQSQSRIRESRRKVLWQR